MRHTVVLAVALALAGAGQAVAQSPEGVIVDPDSPSGREYAIPLEDARSTGSGEDSRAPSGARAPADALFGSGVAPAPGEGVAGTPSEPADGAGTTTPSSGGGDADKADRGARAKASEVRRKGGAGAASTAVYNERAGAAWAGLFSGGAALLVLVLGLVLFLVARARRTQTR